MDNSVDSLLALLRSTQDGPPPSQPTTSNNNTSNTRPVPSSSQLSDLLTSLNARPAPRPPKQGGADQAQGRARKDILEPFGPVGVSARPSVSPVKRSREDTSRGGYEEEGSFGRVRQVSRGESFDGGQVKSARVEEPALEEMSFGKALPIITRLLEDDNLKKELRKMKQDQDSLERRLWAKQEKLKGDHERQTKAEREIAKIARKPIPPEKTKQWSRSLSTALSTFYTQQCIPSIDGLALRQRQRLQELGVPGLGREDGVVDEKVKQRIKRIMEVLEGGLED
ncbi:hypothetical protein B9479_005383 [Cryptococcus floricola]|uniref:Uncharacterized protein n=1 Tax=Cryptococcus floricola TaxID=2591691 RepID=A0A5D3AR56_9TREE|nr:hypothetical protein B9479_005383 [Cryptococcus floricola]